MFIKENNEIIIPISAFLELVAKAKNIVNTINVVNINLEIKFSFCFSLIRKKIEKVKLKQEKYQHNLDY